MITLFYNQLDDVTTFRPLSNGNQFNLLTCYNIDLVTLPKNTIFKVINV